MFLEVKTSWPEFGESNVYVQSSYVNRIRILFEIDAEGRSGVRFKDAFSGFKNRRPKLIDLNSPYKGLLAYKREGVSGEVYLSSSLGLLTPQGTPSVISCSEDNSYGLGPELMKGECRYTLIFDDDLRAQVRFNKPLLENFTEFHLSLLNFINSIRTTN